MLEVVAYGVTPQIHAFDNQSIMETLPILADTVRSARQFIGPSPLMITPITLRLQSAAQPPLPVNSPPAWTLVNRRFSPQLGRSAASSIWRKRAFRVSPATRR